MVGAYYFGASPYLREHDVSLASQRFIVIIILLLGFIPLFYKSRKKQRIGFTTETKTIILRKQDHKCAMCGKGLVRFNVDFDHISGDKSDNRISNCRALCTPCHRKRHANE